MKVIKTYGKYDGSQVAPMWAHKKFQLNENEDSIVVMRGSMDVSREEMVDLEDLKNNEEIKGCDLIHFIVEHNDTNNPVVSYLRQRLFACIVCEFLSGKGVNTLRRGDDLFVDNKKLSVSVATSGKSSMKFHFGVNVTAEGTPGYVEAVGLKEIGFFEDDLKNFVDEICEKYINEIEKIKNDIKKTRVF